MIETIFTEGPLTDLINSRRQFRLAHAGPDAARLRRDRQYRHAWHILCDARVGRRWIAGKHPGNVVSITVTWVRNGGPYVVPSAMSKSDPRHDHAAGDGMGTLWHPAQHDCARRNPDRGQLSKRSIPAMNRRAHH
jgi:hypothetical protein